MQSLFGFHETLESVTNGVLELTHNANDAQIIIHKDAKKKDCNDALCIQSVVDVANFDLIFHPELEKDTWDILVKYYEGGEKVKVLKLMVLRWQNELLQMGEDEKIVGYVSKVQNLVHLMKGCGEVLTDNMITEKAMRTLTSHFDHVIIVIQESNNLETLKQTDLVVVGGT